MGWYLLLKGRRFLTSFGMTPRCHPRNVVLRGLLRSHDVTPRRLCEGSLIQLRGLEITPQDSPRTTLGESWKGGVALVPIECHPEERQRRRVSSLNREGELILLELHPKNFKSLLGRDGDPSLRSGRPKYGRFEVGLFPVSIELRRFLASLEMTGYENHFFPFAFGGKLERG